ncbi:MAG: Geranylgeranyl diphosphate synthase [Promethearchaeota archaeon]|jgi:geranylgeranyl diphosphate synthase type I|nr:MAG: Geranylgeranyl diphosphate synthase [Candidatus Lokiarchaeota archaeon]
MNFIEYSKQYKPKINQVIGSIYKRKIEAVDNVFLKEYYTELQSYFLAGGKRIRPLLCIATYMAFSDSRDDKILTPCVGTEFLHNASLIHDDIIDNDEIRRGEPSFHYRYRQYHQKYNLKKMKAEDFGTSIGIIGGDSAFFLGLEAYLNNGFSSNLNIKGVDLYKKAFIEIANGVLIETDIVNKTDLTMDEYIQMISLKTGALIEKSILIGAVYAQVEEEYLKSLSTYGMNLGIIFQIIDDILGTFGDEKKTGKPTDSDIKEGKKTCLLIEALNKLSDERRNRLISIIEKQNITDEEVVLVKQLFKESKADVFCRELAKSYYKEAVEALDRLKGVIHEDELEFFETLLNFVAEREF